MFILIPYEVRTLHQWNPWANLGLILTNVLMFLGTYVFNGIPDDRSSNSSSPVGRR